MRRLFLSIFLWFALTLLGVGLLVTLFFVHAGFVGRSFVRMSLHDLLIFSVAAAIFCWFIARYLTRPLDRLGDAAAAIAEGRLETRVDPSLTSRRDEIAALARNFDRMAERIEALVNGQRRLLGDVSHELRSPLARLMVALTLVRQGPAEEIPGNLDRIALEARRLDTLIGQLLTLARIDTGSHRGAPATFDLANLVQEVAADADFEGHPAARRVVFRPAPPCLVQGFEELLRSAVENVVRNAVRHTPENTCVEVTVSQTAAEAILAIQDHGRGVPAHMLPEIFRPFCRVPRDGNDEGAGLGLAIAERAVALHGGAIQARNVPEGGLMVEIHLPLPAV